MKFELLKILSLSIVIALYYGGLQNNYSQNINGQILEDNINDISVMDMEGNLVNLSDYNNTVLLIVNVASECGYTYQYEGLEEIYIEYNDLGFEILTFPCNDFGGQEPGSNEEIKTFCSSKFNVSFKLFDKIKVLGDEKSSLYERLTSNSVTDRSDINWNFEKFIISKDGKIVKRFLSNVEPTNEKITDLIEEELSKN